MHGHRHLGGAIVLDGRQTAETLQCVHCGAHWQPEPGSGKRRGWCGSCNGNICGNDICMAACIPYEARLEIEEGTLKTGRYVEEWQRLNQK